MHFDLAERSFSVVSKSSQQIMCYYRSKHEDTRGRWYKTLNHFLITVL